MTNMKLVRPQRFSLCVLQEAVVQAAVQGAGVGDHQAPVMVHEDRVQFTVDTRGLELAKGGVPVLDYTFKKEEEQVKLVLKQYMLFIWFFNGLYYSKKIIKYHIILSWCHKLSIVHQIWINLPLKIVPNKCTFFLMF